MTDDGTLGVTVVYALPVSCWSVAVRVPAGATVGDALRVAAPQAQGIDVADDRLAVFGRPVTPTATLHDGDRIEILRPLAIDPKEGRRLRAGPPSRRK